MKENKVFAVFGLGTFGFEICRILAEKGAKVIAFDNQNQNIEKIKDIVSMAFLLDSRDQDTLRQTPLADVDVAVVSMGDDIEASILTTAILNNLGMPHIIARAVSDLHLQVLRQVGAHEVINPEIEEGNRVAQRLLSPNVLDTIPITNTDSITEVYAPDYLTGTIIKRTLLTKDFNVTLIGLEREKTVIDNEGNPHTETNLYYPDQEIKIRDNDILLILGANKDIEKFKKEGSD